MSSSILQQWFPHTTTPFISSAPMYGVANGQLASAVSKAGGFGFMGGGFDFSPESPQITALDVELSTARRLLNLDAQPDAVLPVGVGFITFHPSVTNMVDNLGSLIKQHKPAAVWLAFPLTQEDRTNLTHGKVIPGLKELGSSWRMKVFVQVGTVAAAREAVSQGADAIVAQGVDAGGHQFAAGAGVISLVPEVRKMVDEEFEDRKIPILAAGGITSGKGVAAALACGADGVTMGTRFIVADESPASDATKSTILNTRDGGVTTIKDTVHDSIRSGKNPWPLLYDGRAIIGDSYKDHQNGLSIDQLFAKSNEAKEKGDETRNIVWCGSGVGLVNEKMSAATIVTKTQAEARQVISDLHSKL